VQVRGFPQ